MASWRLSLKQLVVHNLVLLALLVGLFQFARSFAPPFPERVPGVQILPEIPLISIEEVTPDNGMDRKSLFAF